MSVNKGIIRSIYARLSLKNGQRPAGQNGQALPIVLAALALGIMVVAPFLSHASANLISARAYQQMLYEQYSADAGIEQAIWSLTEDNLASQIAEVNNKTSYILANKVNNLQPAITVTRLSSENKPKKNGKPKKKDTQDSFKIESLAGATSVVAEVSVTAGEVQIDSWHIEK
jgi:type II secretory pathway component PulK